MLFIVTAKENVAGSTMKYEGGWSWIAAEARMQGDSHGRFYFGFIGGQNTGAVLVSGLERKAKGTQVCCSMANGTKRGRMISVGSSMARHFSAIQ